MDLRTIARSFNLFNNGYGVDRVADELRISSKQAKRLKRIYWQSVEIAEAVYKNGNEEITDFYRRELAKERESDVECLLAELKTKELTGFKGLDDPEIESRVKFLLKFLPGTTKILLFPSDFGNVAGWERDS
ncbi:MAG: hypothetical protein HZB99_02780 [Candidatus Harrisonbacteria bacterium]|nr:hypothetical protein [Candidatus Harrisonbacteria bacterium]